MASEQRFAKDFQRHLLAILAQQPEAASMLHQFLDSSYFEGKRNKKAYKFLEKTWRDKKQCPSRALFIEAVADRQLADKLYDHDVTDWKASLEYAAQFAQMQAIKLVIDEWAGKIGEADRAELTTMVSDVKKAILVGQNASEDTGEFFQANLKDHLRDYINPPQESAPIPTGISHLDIGMKGGPLRGELHVIAGRAKVGKSTFLLNIAYGGLSPMVDAKVAFFSLEMKKSQCWERLHKRMALKNDDYIKSAPHDFVRILKRQKQFLTGDMYLKPYPQRTMTASMLEADLDRLAGMGFAPDVVIVDYGNIMLSESQSKEDRIRIGHNFTELRRIAQERDIVVWSGAQGNRGSVKKKTFEMDDIGETYEIPQIVDSMWTLNRVKSEEEEGTGRLVCSAGRRFGMNTSIDFKADLEIGLFRTLRFTSTKSKALDALEGIEKQRAKRKKRRKGK